MNDVRMPAKGGSAWGGKKYWTVFKISWQKELEYRFNFLMSQLRSFVAMLLLYYLWLNLTSVSGKFAAYSRPELITYVFGAFILRSIIFGARSVTTAQEINDGTFSIYLLKPVNHFWYVFWRELAQRSIFLLSVAAQILILYFFLKFHLLWQINFAVWIWFLLAGILALFLYFLLSYLVSLIAFWSREAMGPRFLFEWFLEFSSGAFFPLNILSGAFYVFLVFLPFAYLIYFPISLYLGKLDFYQIITGILIQIFFIAILVFLTRFIWKRGLKRYSGEGI